MMAVDRKRIYVHRLLFVIIDFFSSLKLTGCWQNSWQKHGDQKEKISVTTIFGFYFPFDSGPIYVKLCFSNKVIADSVRGRWLAIITEVYLQGVTVFDF